LTFADSPPTKKQKTGTFWSHLNLFVFAEHEDLQEATALVKLVVEEKEIDNGTFPQSLLILQPVQRVTNM
jgi:hypothetical protein